MRHGREVVNRLGKMLDQVVNDARHLYHARRAGPRRRRWATAGSRRSTSSARPAPTFSPARKVTGLRTHHLLDRRRQIHVRAAMTRNASRSVKMPTSTPSRQTSSARSACAPGAAAERRGSALRLNAQRLDRAGLLDRLRRQIELDVHGPYLEQQTAAWRATLSAKRASGSTPPEVVNCRRAPAVSPAQQTGRKARNKRSPPGCVGAPAANLNNCVNRQQGSAAAETAGQTYNLPRPP